MSLTVVQGSRLIGPIDQSDNLGYYFDALMAHGGGRNKLKDLVENLARSPLVRTAAAVGLLGVSLFFALRKP